MSNFHKAIRTEQKLRLAIHSPSGMGKTYSSLLLAKGLGGKVAVIDTERGSASLYSSLYDFDVAELTPPFSAEKYITLINEAALHYDVIIIDSFSHAWSGEGGMLDMHEKLSKTTPNSFAAWGKITPLHNKLLDAILGADAHIIATMRSKTAYDIQKVSNKHGREISMPVKLGLEPIQRNGVEYEFTTVLTIHEGHVAVASKDRTGVLMGDSFIISEETGVMLKNWLAEAPAADELAIVLLEEAGEAMGKCESMESLREGYAEYVDKLKSRSPTKAHMMALMAIKDENKKRIEEEECENLDIGVESC